MLSGNLNFSVLHDELHINLIHCLSAEQSLELIHNPRFWARIGVGSGTGSIVPVWN